MDRVWESSLKQMTIRKPTFTHLKVVTHRLLRMKFAIKTDSSGWNDKWNMVELRIYHFWVNIVYNIVAHHIYIVRNDNYSKL